MSLVGLLLGLVLSVAKGAFGDLFRAMGLALVLAIRRSQRLSVEYPFLPYARRALAMAPRRPFPPAENPWRYRREDALALAEEPDVEDGVLPPEFSMAQVSCRGATGAGICTTRNFWLVIVRIAGIASLECWRFTS